MVEQCYESGRMLIYQWKLLNLDDKCTIISEMKEYLGLKTFRFALKRPGGRNSKTSFYCISTNLQKAGFKVAKVLIEIQGKPLAECMKANDTAMENLQVFTSECNFVLDDKRIVITFAVHVVGILTHYIFQLSDVLFSDQLWAAAQNRQWTDIEFAVKSHTFSAHQAILAARSPIFFKLFESINFGSKIKLEDVEPAAFEIFLKFLYTGYFQVSNQKEINEEVLGLADKYELIVLSSLCQLAIEEIDASRLTAFTMAFKPNLEVFPDKPQLKETKSPLRFREQYAVIECDWRLEKLPDVDQVLTSDLVMFRNDGAFRAGLADNPITKDSTILSPPHFLYLACSHLEKTATAVHRVDSYVDGEDYCPMERRGENALLVFGRELYGLQAPSAFKFDIMIQETVANYRYQLFDNLRAIHYWSMFELTIATDVEFQVEDNTFFAHRVIISARSPVFAAILSSSSVEAVTGRLRIDRVEPAVFRQFLYFLYTGTLQVSADSTALLKIAERYQVETLIQLCRPAVQYLDVEEISASLIWL